MLLQALKPTRGDSAGRSPEAFGQDLLLGVMQLCCRDPHPPAKVGGKMQNMLNRLPARVTLSVTPIHGLCLGV